MKYCVQSGVRGAFPLDASAVRGTGKDSNNKAVITGIGDFMDKKIQIRNSTVDFLVFTKQNGEDGIEVRVHDEDVWLTQKSMAQLFDCSTDNISLHLKNIFGSGELNAEAVTEKSSATASDGKKYMMKFYNLDAIISVGYRINSIRATQFRQWATKVLKTFTIQGYVLDKKRLENGQIFDEEYFEHLLDEIREIRASERKFYQKITDIYATAVDYSPMAATSKVFFVMVQNKLHYAIHQHIYHHPNGVMRVCGHLTSKKVRKVRDNYLTSRGYGATCVENSLPG